MHGGGIGLYLRPSNQAQEEPGHIAGGAQARSIQAEMWWPWTRKVEIATELGQGWICSAIHLASDGSRESNLVLALGDRLP